MRFFDLSQDYVPLPAPVVHGPLYPFSPLVVLAPLSGPDVGGCGPVAPFESDPVPAPDVPEFPAPLGVELFPLEPDAYPD